MRRWTQSFRVNVGMRPDSGGRRLGRRCCQEAGLPHVLPFGAIGEKPAE